MRYTLNPDAVCGASTQELRDAFLVTGLFQPGQICTVYSEIERAIVGSVVPSSESLALGCMEGMAADYFCERRELGVINLGGKGSVEVDGSPYEMDKCDCLYVGRGSRSIVFSSLSTSAPAQFYLVSYPAHTAYPCALVRKSEVTPRDLGSQPEANVRKLHQMIIPGRVQSCQLVMGFTQLQSGSVWNTMPAHTHDRRSEVYMYFDIAPGAVVFHFMGRPQETRHLVVQEKQVVLSPCWSIHSGAGTGSYTFVWAMGGENQSFDDMDGIAVPDLR